MIIFAIGLILLALEIFVIPGFGVAGISGLALIVISLFMAMVEHVPGTNWFQLPAFELANASKNMGLALTMSLILGLIVARFLPKTSGFSHLMLSTELDREHGVTASAPTDDLLGAKGKSVTPLHPAGFGTFNGKRINVVARGAFIDENAVIVIAETHGNRIVVDIDRTDEQGTRT